MARGIDILKAKLPKAPTGRRPIGYRGNHQHGKSLYDPVYPTTKIPTSLVPRYPIDWRNGGRFLLCVGLRRIENRIIKRMKESQDFNRPECKTCSHDCIATYNRCLCAWYCKDEYKHVYQCDELLLQYKGETPTDKPLFTVPRWVAKRNSEQGVEYQFSEKTGRFENAQGEVDVYKLFYKKLHYGADSTAHEVGGGSTTGGRAIGGRAIGGPAEEGQLSGSDSDMTDSDEEG
ncbi:hypothetical protein PCYB_145950 [Plasmodium cynomolgi strain B]|uniref:Uncharacterized protein n=1 Tax=Plasmodium cynomolgi (strain B) TaxID=1120755 RepID=K6UEY6_PLACD|nr:hypothetical protein PCYB_145950 [Plasmodium cynomolgi strain B]GAB69166.1 hypothetical protein PCYB_145950 [Plasmodium cynomolgi strain B]